MGCDKPGHKFWSLVLKNIDSVVAFVNGDGYCAPDESGNQKYRACSFLNLFHSPFTSNISNIVYTQFMTGSAMLDKTCVLEGLRPTQLDTDIFYGGEVCTHHQHNTWSNTTKIIVAFREIGSLLFLAAIVIIAATLLIARKTIRN